MGLVGRVVTRTLRLFPYLPGGYERDDVRGLGNLGLVRAAQSFDPARGVRFSTYACRCIENAIACALQRETAREINCASLTQPFPGEEETLLEDEVVDPGADTVRTVLKQCDREVLMREIAGLSKQHAQLLRALYFQGISVDQIAASWHRSSQTVAIHQVKALKLLRRRLRHLGFR
jgi:RNA polymerase sporulation-specific sigma factor